MRSGAAPLRGPRAPARTRLSRSVEAMGGDACLEDEVQRSRPLQLRTGDVLTSHPVTARLGNRGR